MEEAYNFGCFLLSIAGWDGAEFYFQLQNGLGPSLAHPSLWRKGDITQESILIWTEAQVAMFYKAYLRVKATRPMIFSTCYK